MTNKRLSAVSIFIILALILAILPLNIFAVETSDGDTALGENVVTISSLAELESFRDSVNGGNTYEGYTVALFTDVELTDEWTPIGNGSRNDKSYTGAAFCGTFVGGGHTVSGLNITSTDSSAAVGFFGVVDGGAVQNIVFENVSVNTKSKNAGTAAGLITGGAVVDGITVKSGTLTGVDGVGGIVGRATVSGTVMNSVNNASVHATVGAAAGIVGKAYYTEAGKEMNITKCINNGAVTAVSGSSAAGGIVGFCAANVTECENNGAVSAEANVGGIVGWAQMYGKILDNKNNASIDAPAVTTAGGIVGWINYQYATDGTAAEYGAYEIITVSGNENNGSINAPSTALGSGGIVGGIYNAAKVINNINNAEAIVGAAFAAGVVGNLQRQSANGYYDDNGITVSDNVSNTAEENITANCVNIIAYDNNGDVNTVANNVYGKTAKIGETYYATLADAINALAGGETITLLTDVEIDYIIAIDKSFTLDGNGHTIYTSASRGINNNSKTAAADVTVRNVTVDGTKASLFERGINYNSFGTLTLNNVTVTGGATYALNLPAASDGATVVINNSNLDGCIAINAWGDNTNITATDSSLVSTDNSAAENYSAIQLNNDGTNIANGTVVNVIGGSITAKDENGEPSYAVLNNTETGEVNISDTTAVCGTFDKMVAAIMYGNSFNAFASVEGALNYADKGETVKLLTDVFLESSAVIDSDIEATLDLCGHSVTVGLEDGNTERHIYAITNYGNLTLTDSVGTGSINARGIYNYGVMTVESGKLVSVDTNGGAGVLNYGTLTVNGGVFEGYCAVNNQAGATATVNNMTATTGANWYAINNVGNMTVNDATIKGDFGALWNKGTIEVVNGHFECTSASGAHAFYSCGGNATIWGGEFVAFASGYSYGIVTNGECTVTVNGGSFSAGLGGSVAVVDYGHVTINAGEFAGAVRVTSGEDGTIEMLGGEFAKKPTYAKENYLVAKNNESDKYTVIENTYFTYLGEDLREKDEFTVADIRYSYDFADEFEFTNWGWSFYAEENSSYKKTVEGKNATEENITRLVVTNLGIANWEKNVCAVLWFEVEIDGVSYTVYDGVRSANVYGTATDLAADAENTYATAVISAYDATAAE